MKFDRCALSGITVTPTVRVTDQKTGKVTVIPPSPGSYEAYIKLENFTGRLTFGMDVTKLGSESANKILSSAVPMDSEDKNDEVASSKQPPNIPSDKEDETNDESCDGFDEESNEDSADEYSLSDSFREMYFESRMESMM